jgi:hypothetical protein
VCARYTWACFRAGPGRQKARLKTAQARPDCWAVFCYPNPACRAKKCRAVGPGLPKICQIFCPSPARLVNRAKFLCLGPARRAKIRGRAGPFSGRAGSGHRAGLPMLRYSARSHARITTRERIHRQARLRPCQRPTAPASKAQRQSSSSSA